MRQVRMLLVAELDVGEEPGRISDAAQAKLEKFREAVGPSAEHGITLVRATRQDVEDFKADQVRETMWVPVRPVPERLFQVNEWSSGFEVQHVPTGKTHWMSDGVDALFDEEGHAFSPGDPGFRELWEHVLNETPDETLAAYFPDEFDKQAEAEAGA